jgi:hypothetical protein
MKAQLWQYIKTHRAISVLGVLLLLACIAIVLLIFALNGKEVSSPWLGNYLRVQDKTTPVVTKAQLDKYYSIKGSYKYRCKSQQKNHGGICSIDIIPTENGLQWKLIGKRMWEELRDSLGKLGDVRTLAIPYKWETTWGDFISKDNVAYTYEITKVDKHIKGYAEGTVENSDYITGNYWQLPPEDPLFGYFEFRRQKDNSDITWNNE